MELFRGFVPTKRKKCLIPFKDKPSSELKSYDEVKDLDEYAGILAEDTILIDIDDMEQSEKMMDIVEDLQLNCRVYQTTRGRHFLFKNKDVDSCSTHSTLAIGLTADIKIGKKNSYSILKFNGEERFIEWDSETYDVLPRWLLKVNYAPDFNNLGAGAGRNQELFNYILNLQSNGFSKDECKQCIKIINKYVLAEPLSDDEVDVILRDDAFNVPTFFNGKTFLFDKFAQFLKSEYHIVRINGQLHIYNNGIYDYAQRSIETKMIDKIPTLKAQQRTEVMKYLDLICEDIEPSEANYIAFKNGVYDISTDKMVDYTPEIILTNRINHNYNPSAYNELTDNTLNKIACNDVEVRATNMERELVCVVDTDSLMLHFSHLINEFQTDVGNFKMSCICASAFGTRLFANYIVPEFVSHIMINCGIEDKYYRDKFVFKNEFTFAMMILFQKKMYLNSMFVQEGNPRDIHEIDAKGVSFKKRDTAEFLEPYILDVCDKYLVSVDNISIDNLTNAYYTKRQQVIQSVMKSTSDYKKASIKDESAYEKSKTLPMQMRGTKVWNSIEPNEEILPMDRVYVIPLSWERLESTMQDNVMTRKLYETCKVQGGNDPVICLPETYSEIPVWVKNGIDAEYTSDKLLAPYKQILTAFNVYLPETKGSFQYTKMLYI